MKIRVINKSKHPLPQYETEQSAGLDLRANLDGSIELKPLERQLVKTGLFIELPAGYEAQVRPRSGLSWKKGLSVLNSPGTIDADYRGEVMIAVINLGRQPYTFCRGDRIAQMVINRVHQVELQEVDHLDETHRNTGGFGHTGK